MRDDLWLRDRLDKIWETLFGDVEKLNCVVIRFKGRYRNKFGHIKRLKNGDSEIIVNGMFRDERIPEFIIDLTLAHELIHYMHGFNSPHKKLFKYPHQNRIVENELRKRGFYYLKKLEKKWIKEDWLDYLKRNF
ncbi:MAG TPA: hypothetical protein VJB89_00190 [Candidatus Nanoarchaeia archaeon]|nr:hypothetical protein [Candidatus Nanoarchaeia archaeon]